MAGHWYDCMDDVSEFQEHLPVDLSSKGSIRGWVFWGPPENLQPPVHDSDNISISGREIIKNNIKCLLEKMTRSSGEPYLAQFWAPKVIDQYTYLTNAHQPFAVGRLCKAFSLYRKRCMVHRYRVDDGAREEELGVVGRVYRNKHPESTPDLGLYSSKEFPLRDDAARCGLRSLLVVPVFDLRKEKCYGVLEVSYPEFRNMNIYILSVGLEEAGLRTTHQNLGFYSKKGVDGEITKMLELAIKVIPQLQMAQVWVPCNECPNTSSIMTCMERADFPKKTEDRKVNSLMDIDIHMNNYREACDIHNLHGGKCTNMIAAVMSSNTKCCICRNICDFSISDNPLAHYAQKARLSFCFAICLQSLRNSRDIYLVEFFLQANSREDEIFGSILQLLLRIMEMELKSFEFAYRGQVGGEIEVEVCEGNKISSNESSQSIVLQNESLKYKHQQSEEPYELTKTKGFKKMYLLSDFIKSLEKADLHCVQPSEGSKRGWVFWSQARTVLSVDEVHSNSPLLPISIQEKIKSLLREITSISAAYSLAQFWAPKVDVNRCKLETLGQPFALGCLYQGLAFFRKQCMKHCYFVDEGAKEDELGPPGRVFLNGHRESTPDLRLYSTTEFPLKNHATHCHLRKYLALPVFDMNQLKCVGVLELFDFSKPALEVVGKALEAANFSSTHINFKRSFLRGHQPVNDFKCQLLALNEIKDACTLFKVIPQLYMAELWVSNSKCPCKGNTLSCIERVWKTKDIKESDLPECQVQHVKVGKGIAGMALASENRSCFCGNLGGFSIADRPLAHYEQADRLDVCFAICLQCRYTGDLLYILKFYLNQGPRDYEYLRSFLCLLLPIMKQKLKNFKVASGQQLGEKLVVEVIEFSDVNELASSEIDHPDVFPFTLKYVKYHTQKYSKDKQVHFAPEESVTSDAQEELGNNSAPNLKEKRENHLGSNIKDLQSHSGQKRKDAEHALDISESTLKRICKEYGTERWQQNENQEEDTCLFVRESVEDPSHQNASKGVCRNVPPSNMPLHQNVPLTDPKSSQDLITQPKVDMVFVYAKYESKTIKFKLSRSAGMEKLVNEVATRLKLDVGCFEMEYLDEINEKILLTCDSDLELCLESMGEVDRTCINMFVHSI